MYGNNLIWLGTVIFEFCVYVYVCVRVCVCEGVEDIRGEGQ